MSTQVMDVVSSFRQSEIFDITRSYIESIKYDVQRVSGCRHTEMSRPFTHEQETYRACLSCGMHRAFDVENWRMTGRYYAPPVNRRQGN